MSITSEIKRIKSAIASAYSICDQKGATIPESQVVANLASTIQSITGGGGQSAIAYAVVRTDTENTVTFGTQTAVASDGTCVFPVYVLGDYTVTISDSEGSTNSGTMSITSAGQVGFLEIHTYLSLDLTMSSWATAAKVWNGSSTSTATSPTLTVGDGWIQGVNGNNKGGIMYYASPIDITEYSRVSITGNFFTSGSSVNLIRFLMKGSNIATSYAQTQPVDYTTGFLVGTGEANPTTSYIEYLDNIGTTVDRSSIYVGFYITYSTAKIESIHFLK